MLLKEYRIIMPMNVDEYFLGQLYMVAKSSQEESGKEAGEGVEILRNEPYEPEDPVNKYGMPKGQYTEKVMHLKSRLPKFIAMLVPDAMTDIVEHSWNAFPHCRTEYHNAYYGDKFMLSVESVHANDRGTQGNAVGLSESDLEKRKVDYINIACADSYVKMAGGEDPTKVVSAKTGRGCLKPTFIEDHDPVMCCYKVVKLRFKVFALQSKVESWGQQYGIRNPFLQGHRRLFCWIDEWYGLSIMDIRKMEEETARITKQKIEESLRRAEGALDMA